MTQLKIQQSHSLRLTEVFASIQGETSWSGLPTTFIRLSACNLRCRWCDTPYSFGRGDEMNLDDLIQVVQDYGHPYICVTGGEPLLQEDVHPLMKRLCDLGFKVSIETGGSLPIDPIDPRVKVILDIKCPGSEMENRNDWSNIERLKPTDEVKFVIADHKDYQYAKGVLHQHQLNTKTETVLFSPVHGELDPKELVEWTLADRLPVRIQVQIHKVIWGVETKGV